jgi:DNA uptake protein ComE-like DNA-binding protein
MKIVLTRDRESGSIFVLVLWISFGLVVLSLYFANSMNFELRAADNRAAMVQANAAIAGGARYAAYLLSVLATNGVVPDADLYNSEFLPVGESSFWFLGENDGLQNSDESLPVFGLVDESSKINLNTATVEMLQALPGMTAEFAAAIVDWRDGNSDLTENGAEDESYQRLTPARRCKNGAFESVDELRLVYGANLEVVYGEDSNRNGVLDLNENDGTVSLPYDNADGRLDRGMISYVTVWSRQPNTQPDGSAKVRINTQSALTQLLRDTFDASRAAQILGRTNTQFRSILDFFVRSGMSAEEFAAIEDKITTSNGTVVEGLINVNTASLEVLACVPGIGQAKASTLVAHRLSNASQLTSIAWVKDVLDAETITEAGPFLTGRSYQFSADIAALGRHNRGFRRCRFIFDTSGSVPRVIYRQDLSHLGWALGQEVRENLRRERQSRL